MKKFLIFSFIFTFSLAGSAQEFGGNRFSTRWRQINTDTARIIFPKGLDTSAQRIANTIHNIASKNIFSLGNNVKKIDIVLQPQSILSNGYVGLGPYRSEYYMTPPPDNFDLGTIDWPDQLALHEYRHVQQYNNFNNGASKVMGGLFGEEGLALAINASVPDWFYEGDAVFQETVLSQQGRGRMPSFLKAYPALWEAGKNYSWMKLRNGSYKDYVPNHYELGYLLVNYGYEKYGPGFWKNVTHDASAFKGWFYPMQKAVKKYSGLKYKDFTKQALDYYKEIYEEVPGFEVRASRLGRSISKFVTNYYYPQQISGDSLIYLKNSYGKRPAFYVKHNNGETMLRFRDISIDEQFSYKNGKIVYTAFETHPRRQWHNYSVIKILDVSSNQQRTLQHKTRYFSPDISEDGKRIVANHVSVNGKSSLVLLNSETGAVFKEFKADSITYFSNPKFLTNTKIATAIRLKSGKNFIGIWDAKTGQIRPLIPATYNTVGQVSTDDGFIYFTGSEGLRNDLYVVDTGVAQLMNLDIESFANYFPHYGYGKMSYSTFTERGYQVRQLSDNEIFWKPAYLTEDPAIALKKADKRKLFLDSISKRSFTTLEYQKLTKPFNIHSWRPNYEDPVFSFTVYGNNILNTVETQVQYEYNENDKTHAFGGSLLYGGLFPYLNIGSKYTLDRSATINKKLKQWNQWDNYAGVSIPLNWTSGLTHKFFNWGALYSYRTDFNKGFYADTFRTVRFGYLLHQLSWGQQVQRARLDIFPRWGYNLNVQYRHSVNFYKGWQAYSKVNLFAPGMLPAHSFYITGAFQEAGTRDRIFGNRFPFARGFNAVDSARLAGVTFNYHFPVAYPDWGFANIFYLMRLRTGLFYDYTRILGKATSFKRDLASTGAELYFDTKWWNQHPLTFGVRGSYLLKPDPVTEKKKFFFEFILPVSLIPR